TRPAAVIARPTTVAPPSLRPRAASVSNARVISSSVTADLVVGEQPLAELLAGPADPRPGGRFRAGELVGQLAHRPALDIDEEQRGPITRLEPQQLADVGRVDRRLGGRRRPGPGHRPLAPAGLPVVTGRDVQ